MAGVDCEAEGAGILGCALERLERLSRLLRPAEGVGVTSGVQFDRGDLELRRALDAPLVGIDEEAGADPGGLELGEGGDECGVVPVEGESPLGRDLLPSLRNESGLVGTDLAGQVDDVGAGGELEIERPGDP